MHVEDVVQEDPESIFSHSRKPLWSFRTKFSSSFYVIFIIGLENFLLSFSQS